jgi:hypothetical protein
MSKNSDTERAFSNPGERSTVSVAEICRGWASIGLPAGDGHQNPTKILIFETAIDKKIAIRTINEKL